ncbi:MAG: hypothetical protein SGPRY_005077 [Prymnesium sp.]
MPFVMPTCPLHLEEEQALAERVEPVRAEALRFLPPHAPPSSPSLLQVSLRTIDLIETLKDTSVCLRENNALRIEDKETFALLYSIVRSFANMTQAVQKRTCEVIFSAVKNVTRGCKRALASSASDADLALWRSALQRAVFLHTWLVQEAEKNNSKFDTTTSSTRPRKGTKASKEATDEKEPRFWESLREDAALRMIDVLELDLRSLWGYRSPDDAFVVAISRATYALLEQPAAGKSASYRQTLWRVLALIATKYEQREATLSGVMRLLLEFEHLASPLAELVHSLLEEHSAVPLVVELLSELAVLSPSQMGADSGGASNVSTFLQAIAQRVPLMLVCNLPLLEPHLDSEAYTIRCGAISACGELLTQLAKPEIVKLQPSQPELAETAPLLFGVLLSRLNDVSGYVRSRALQTLAQVCRARALGLDEFQEACAHGLGRLVDKNANVRRSALQLLAPLLEFNPFGPVLDGERLRKRRDELAQRVKEERGRKGDGEDEQREGEEGAEQPPPSPREKERLEALNLLARALAFEEELQKHMPTVVQLLSSSTNSDVVEAMGAVVAAHGFELAGVRPATILPLVWSKESAVKEAALKAVHAVWLCGPEGGKGSPMAHTVLVARGLMALVDSASLAELSSLEEVVGEWQAAKALPASLLSILWESLQGKRPELHGARERRCALALLNMAAACDASLLSCKMDVLIQQLKGGDVVMQRHACVGLQLCATSHPLTLKAKRTTLELLRNLLLSRPSGGACKLWYATAEQAINTIFALSEGPEGECTEVLRGLRGRVAGEVVEEEDLARLLFVLGHVAIKSLVRIEHCEKELTKHRMNAVEGPKASKGGERMQEEEEEEAVAKELGSDAAAAAADSEALHAMGERLLEPEAFLGQWAPLVVAVCSNVDGHFGTSARVSATLTLCKFMCVSSAFCEDHLQLLFSVLAHESDHTIRGNICIALGDLAVRHPNVVEPWTAKLYAQLRDKNVRVRKNMLMVLTHLILNDMVKVKGQISEMALCLLDTEPKVADTARLFFTEFAKKGSSPIYNLYPDLVATLSASACVDSAGFRQIMAFLSGFIQKERQTEGVVEKLCHRFDTSDDVAYHRDIAFCIGALSHSERSIRKLHELSKTYVHKLTDEEVGATLSAMVVKTRKFAKPSMKALLDEMDATLLGQEGKPEEMGEAPAEVADENCAPQSEVPKPQTKSKGSKAAAKGGTRVSRATRKAVI